MDANFSIHFTENFPAGGLCVRRLSVRFRDRNRYSSQEVTERSKRLLADAAQGMGGTAIADFRYRLVLPLLHSRSTSVWWEASGVLMADSLPIEGDDRRGASLVNKS